MHHFSAPMRWHSIAASSSPPLDFVRTLRRTDDDAETRLPDCSLDPRVVVLIPCLNEEQTIAQVVRDFRAELPDATIFVYDNASTDATASVAAQAGAQVRHCEVRGKGNVVRRMFSEVDADVYVLVDGDATYEAEAAQRMIALILCSGVDMCVARREPAEPRAYRAGHVFGNALLTGLVGWLFGPGASDMLSGYRTLSRRFVKSFSARSSGFEIEAELTIHALRLGVSMRELTSRYRARPPQSKSKLRTVRDGLRILWLVLRLHRSARTIPRLGVVPVDIPMGSG